jgi:hypothetical protein
MQAAYFLERLGGLRFDAEASRAKLYVDLQRMVNAGESTRAGDLRGLVRAKEAEVVALTAPEHATSPTCCVQRLPRCAGCGQSPPSTPVRARRDRRPRRLRARRDHAATHDARRR